LIVAILCALRVLDHDPERIATAAGFAFRCRDCGRTATTEAELLHLDGYVSVERRAFDRDQRNAA
jgi:hypothetical protein